MGNCSNNPMSQRNRIKSSYYQLLDKELKKKYEKNRYDLFNQNYSLFSKDFKKCYVNQKIPNTEAARQYIPWKLYLLIGLKRSEEENNYPWAQNLYNSFINDTFPEQVKFQNMFFYSEYEILTKPKTSKQELNNTEKIILPDEITKKDEIFFDKDDPLYTIKATITNNLMGSFISDSTGGFESIKSDPNSEYKYNKNKIKDYLNIFQKHICLKEHPINKIISRFISEFEPYINDTIDLYKNNKDDNKKECDEQAQKLIEQLQDFIVLLQSVTKLFYSRCISYIYFKDEKDEFLNLISFIIFNNNKIYKKFFDLFELMNEKNINELKKKFQKLGKLNPEDVGIKEKFCLNQKTDDFMAELKLKNKKVDNNDLVLDINGKEKKIDDDNIIKEDNDDNIINTDTKTNKDDNEVNNNEGIQITSDTGKLNSLTKDFWIKSDSKEFSKEPYGKAIEFIKTIEQFKTPLEKLIIIASVSSLITECVNSYWKNMGGYIKPSMLSIDADELMTILIYIIYQSKNPLLFVHADFINYFTSATTKSTMIGYYYTTLQGCLDYLLQINDKEDFKKDIIE